MSVRSIALSEDLAPWVMWTTAGLFCVAVVLLLIEARRHQGRQLLLIVSGVMAALFVVAAVFRPVSVDARTTPFGPRIVALVDDSRRLLIPTGDATRRQLAGAALERLQQHFEVYYNTGLTLVTIKNYDPETFESYRKKPGVILEQSSRSTLQVLLRNQDTE